jgi:2-dehydropantoate 2-reductase
MADMQRIAVAGAGAMGSVAGGYMALAGHAVTFVDAWLENVDAINSNGLRIVTPERESVATVKAIHVDNLAAVEEPFDIVLLAVKSYDTEWMARAIAPYLGSRGVVVSVQNGLNEERIAGVVGPERTIGCVVHMAGALWESGVVSRYSGDNWLTYTIGEWGGSEVERIKLIQELMSCVGPTHVTTDIRAALWAKLTLNVMLNGLTGITGYPTPRLWGDPRGLSAMVALANEAVQVCRSERIEMDPIEPTGAEESIAADALVHAAQGDRQAYDRVQRLFLNAAANRSGKRENASSLLQDIRKGRPTEIDFLNGEIVRRGRIHGLSTPINERVVGLVHQLESGHFDPSPDALNRVLGAEPSAADSPRRVAGSVGDEL